MTTPERLRARQRREFWLIMFLSAMFLSSTYVADQRDEDRANEIIANNARDDRQDLRQVQQARATQACLIDQFGLLTDALSVRSRLTEQESANFEQVVDDIASLALASGSITDPRPVADALQRYKMRQAEIKKGRKETKVPPFPTGTCEGLATKEKPRPRPTPMPGEKAP